MVAGMCRHLAAQGVDVLAEVAKPGFLIELAAFDCRAL
jgi:hypothetical protein